MFGIHIGATPHELQPHEFDLLGQLTEGFSGSDISIVVQDALMEAVRTVQHATHFKKVVAPCRNDESKMRDYLTPCSPGEPGAIEMTWEDIEGDELLEPKLTLNHVKRALRNTKPSVSQDDLDEHVKFTDQFGQDG